jgi:hypothetical protein
MGVIPYTVAGEWTVGLVLLLIRQVQFVYNSMGIVSVVKLMWFSTYFSVWTVYVFTYSAAI